MIVLSIKLKYIESVKSIKRISNMIRNDLNSVDEEHKRVIWI